MKYIDLKDKSLTELAAMLKEKKIGLFTLKTKLKTMQVTNTSELRVTKKDIARLQMAIDAKRSEV
jgi:large subunit ribosomal protein L29